MGLDMWVRKVRKLTKEELESCKWKYFDNFPFTCFLKSDLDNWKETRNMFHDIMPMVSETQVRVKTLDMGKIQYDYNIPNETHCCGFSHSNDTITYRFYDNNPASNVSYKAEIPKEEYDKYIIEKMEECWAIYMEEVKYWRKAYDLNEKLYSLYSERHANFEYLLNCFKDNPDETIKMTTITDATNRVADALLVSKEEAKSLVRQIRAHGYDFCKSGPANIDNCGYYALDHDMAKACGLTSEFKKLKKDELLVYHEWY